MPAPNRRTQAVYNKIVAGFRESPGNFQHAANVAGVDRRMAKKCWESGWPARTWARPIRDVIREEHDKSLAAISQKYADDKQEADTERERARAMSLVVREEEEKIKRACRATILGMHGTIAQLFPGVRALTSKVLHETCDRGPGGDWVPKPPAQITIPLQGCLDVIEKVTRAMARTTEMSKTILEQGRLDRGEPTEILQASIEREMTPEEAAKEIEEQEAALQIIRQEAADLRKDQGLH